MSIKEQYAHVRDEVAAVAEAAGRNPDNITLVAVSKTVGINGVAEAIEAGANNFGENRPDQLLLKARAFPRACWHFIGNIQSRRIDDIVSAATLIHSVFQERHLHRIQEAAERHGKVQDLLIEVNVSGEISKSGVSRDETLDLVQAVLAYPRLRVKGLMAMAPQGDLSVASEVFRELAELARRIRAELPETVAPSFNELSMGMSEDWREAIRAGATIVRIGRAVFSEDFAEKPVSRHTESHHQSGTSNTCPPLVPRETNHGGIHEYTG